MRNQSGITRRRVQRAKTLCCYPPLVSSRSPSGSPNPPKTLMTASGVPAAIGLDCFELRRRSRNVETARCLSHISCGAEADVNSSTRTSSSISFNIAERGRRERYGSRRIQSLNRYSSVSSNRTSCQLSWENLSTKPPRPPTTHSSTTTSPLRSQTLSAFEVPTGRMSELVNKEEGVISTKSHHQLMREQFQTSDPSKPEADAPIVSLYRGFQTYLWDLR